MRINPLHLFRSFDFRLSVAAVERGTFVFLFVASCGTDVFVFIASAMMRVDRDSSSLVAVKGLR